jgi:hypothetical protein
MHSQRDDVTKSSADTKSVSVIKCICDCKCDVVVHDDVVVIHVSFSVTDCVPDHDPDKFG